ncbi:MAG: hypothetical protein QXV09_05380, partial [Candidatus Bathyarchaeia archaeon]
LNTIVLLLITIIAVFLAANFMSEKVAAEVQNVGSTVFYEPVDLKYLAKHIEEFKNADVKVNGTVRYYASIYMFEDLWLQAGGSAKIPVVTRFAGLPKPTEGLFIEVVGQIEYSSLEGGFLLLERNLMGHHPANTATKLTRNIPLTIVYHGKCKSHSFINSYFYRREPTSNAAQPKPSRTRKIYDSGRRAGCCNSLAVHVSRLLS